MSEENESQDEATAKAGKPWLMIALVAVLCLALGAGGAFFLAGGDAPAPEEAAEAAAAAAAETQEAESWADRVLALEPFVVNVSDDGYGRYLKLKLELEADSPQAAAELEARLALVRDTVILLLSSKRLADISDFEGKALLKDDLRERINGLLEHGRVDSVLFTEFVVQ